MSIEKRRELIAKIQKKRNTLVIVYFLGDRQGVPTRIAGDAVTLMYKHLCSLKAEKVQNLDLFIYSNGGDIEVPWRIATMFREVGKKFSVLIPYRAMSAATLLALSADEIIMSPKGELGPIDPTLATQTEGGKQQDVSVEDVVAYFDFLNQRAGIRDQAALSSATNILAEQLTPLVIGKVHRVHSHIREVARKMLESRTKRLSDNAVATIISTLAEETHSHGHAIGRHEAKSIGLPIAKEDKELENLMWELYLEYEDDFQLLDPIVPSNAMFKDNDYKEIPARAAAIESLELTHEFRGEASIQAKRATPQQLNLNLNLSLPIAQGAQAQPDEQQLQNLMQVLRPQIQKMAEDEIRKASPIQAIEMRFLGKWQPVKTDS